MSHWPFKPSWLEALLAELSTLPALSLPLFAEGSGLRYGESVGKALEIGADVEESRAYQAGDPVRLINWRLSARSDELYVKYQAKPTELRSKLLVDLRASAWQGSEKLKAEQIVAVAFRLAQALSKVSVVDTQVWASHPINLPVLRGLSRWPSWCAQWQLALLDLTADASNVEPVLSEALWNVADQWLVIVSDFLDWDQQLEDQLLEARQRGQVLLVHVLDPIELVPPVSTGIQWGSKSRVMMDTETAVAYQEAMRGYLQRIQQTCIGFDLHYWPMQSNQSLMLLGQALGGWHANDL